MQLNRKIEFLMKQKNIKSISQLSHQMGIPYTTLNDIYIGKNTDIKLSTSKKICNFFNITLDELLDDDVNMNLHCFDITGLDSEDIENTKKYIKFLQYSKNLKD